MSGALGACGRGPYRQRPLPAGVIDDASRLNATPIAKRVRFEAPSDSGRIAALRGLLRTAREEGRPLCMGGVRHSSGGQALPPAGGYAADLGPQAVEVDRQARRVRVPSGTRWRDLLPVLDAAGLSPAVMQSNNDFTVGGSFSVNAHGWPVPFGPMAETVRKARLMLAGGEVVECSRETDPELFRLTMGGYGLLGVLLDLELDVVPNVLLRPSRKVLPIERFPEHFLHAARDRSVRMAYGRMNVTRGGFLEQAILTSYRVEPGEPAPLAPGPPEGGVKMQVFRGQAGSDAGKQYRWLAESALAPILETAPVSRNSLLNVPTSAVGRAEDGFVDVLQEYFVPLPLFPRFVQACQRIVPGSGQDLLNVTLRLVDPDHDSVLAYAPRNTVIAAVMLFHQRIGGEAETAMRRMTQRLTQAALDLGGSFYLPYRPHVRPDQVKAAYPRLPQFVAAKRRYDPHMVLRSQFWDRYLAGTT